jgi:hypothetical protein
VCASISPRNATVACPPADMIDTSTYSLSIGPPPRHPSSADVRRQRVLTRTGEPSSADVRAGSHAVRVRFRSRPIGVGVAFTSKDHYGLNRRSGDEQLGEP